MATCTYTISDLNKMYGDLEQAQQQMETTLDLTNQQLEQSQADLETAQAEAEAAEAEAEVAEAAAQEAEAAAQQAEAVAASIPPTIEEVETYVANGKTFTRTVTKPNPAYAPAQQAAQAARKAAIQAAKEAKVAKNKAKQAKKVAETLEQTVKELQVTVEDLEQSISDTKIYKKAVKAIINTAENVDLKVSDIITVDWGTGTFTANHRTYSNPYSVTDTMYNGGMYGASLFSYIAEHNAETVVDGFHHYTIQIGDRTFDVPLEAFSSTGNVDDIPWSLNDKALVDKVKEFEILMGDKGPLAVQRLLADMGMSPDTYRWYLTNTSNYTTKDGVQYSLGHNYTPEEVDAMVSEYVNDRLPKSARLNNWNANSSWVSMSHIENNLITYTGINPDILAQLRAQEDNPGLQSQCYALSFYACISTYLGYGYFSYDYSSNQHSEGGYNFKTQFSGSNRPAYYKEGAESKIEEYMGNEDCVGVMLHYWSNDGSGHWVVVEEWNGSIENSTYYDPWYNEIRSYEDMTFHGNNGNVFEVDYISVS